MNKYLLCCIFTLLFTNCVSTNTMVPQRGFNFENFGGHVSKQVTNYEDVVLDWDFSDKKGQSIHFTSCVQVDSTSEESILTSEYHRFRILSIECNAVKLYIEKGVQAKRSYFPDKLTQELLYEFPAVVGPIVHKDYMEERVGKTLKEHESFLDILIIDKNRAEVLTQTDEITFDIMARADFNGDGIEDLLVRTLWYVRDAFGKGSNLFILEKISSTGPILLTWRYTKV